MTVATYRPQVSVVLKKNIGRKSAGGNIAASDRFQGSARSFNLAPYLGDNGSIVASKSVREAAGMFSVTLADRVVQDQGDSLYGFIEPMDVVEIRMARSPTNAGRPDQLPIIMRGFVSEVRRELMMTDEGPQRTVTISGQDYGKILQIMRIVYLAGMVVGQDLLSAYKLALNYGPEAKADQEASAFIGSLLSDVVTPFLQKMQQSASGSSDASPVLMIKPDLTPGAQVVSPFGTQEWGQLGGPGSPVFDMMRYFGDVGPWNELYVEDRTDAPYLVYRPTPFKDLSGNLLQAAPNTPVAMIDVTDASLVGMTSARSDADVANYFWVDAPAFSQLNGTNLQAMAAVNSTTQPVPFVEDYPNCSPNFYGVRVMEVQTQQGSRMDGHPAAEIYSSEAPALQYLGTKRKVLIDSNRDNVVLERGSMRLKGNETVKAGSYVRLTRGSGMQSQHYAYRVQHEFQPMRGFFTTVDYDRGTGFVERIQRGGGASAPYFAEMKIGGAYG